MTTTDSTAPSDAWIGRHVDQHGHAPPAGGGEHDLLGAHRLRVAQHAPERESVEGNLAPVGKAAGHGLHHLLVRLARAAQALHEPARLAVDRDRTAGRHVEHQHAERRGLDQRLKAGAGAPLGAVGPRIGDCRRGLGGEQHQELLVLVGELPSALLLAEEEVADLHIAMAHRRALEGVDDDPVDGEAERLDIGGHVRHPQRRGQVPQRVEDLHAVVPRLEQPLLLRREARQDDVGELAFVAEWW